MDILNTVWNYFNTNIFKQPAFFCGLIVFIGYLLLSKPFYEAFAGFIKAVVGYMILNVGSSGLTNNFRPLLVSLNQRFNLNAAVIDPYYGQVADKALIEAAGRSLSLALSMIIVGFFVNILLVALKKITKCRSLMITGHTMVGQSYAVCWILCYTMPDLNDMMVIVLGGIALGIFWAVGTNLTADATQKLSHGAGFSIGHNQCFGIWLADKLGPKLGGKDAKSIGDIKFPGFLAILNDSVVATGTVMLLFIGTILVVMGKDFLTEIGTYKGSIAFEWWVLETALYFDVYMQILLTGVRMFVAEMSESFHGISSKLLPGVVAGIDCASSYNFAPPTAMTFGFLAGCLGQFICIIGLIVFKSPILIITGFVPVFFDNATIAVYANRRGGAKAAAILAFASGCIQVIGGAFCASFLQQYQFGGARGSFDWATVWAIIPVLIKYSGYIGYAAVMIALLSIPQIQYFRNKEGYFLITDNYEEYEAKYGND